MERDQPAHRMANQVRRRPALGVHQRERVFGHLLDCERSANGLASSHAAIVEGEAFVVRREFADLRSPSAAVDAHALDQDHRRAAAANLKGEIAPFWWTVDSPKT